MRFAKGDRVLITRDDWRGVATVIEPESLTVEFDEGQPFHPSYRAWGIKEFGYMPEYKIEKISDPPID
jgi:hypothetical protein